MASPPYQGASSPTASSNPLALPRRTSLALPNKSRKSSFASQTPSGHHPLRQTSFPPSDSLEAQHQHARNESLLQYSPGADDNNSLDDLSDTDITSAISGPISDVANFAAPKKRKPGEKRARGRPPKNASVSRVGSVQLGDEGRSAGGRSVANGGTPSVVAGQGGEGDEEDDDDEEDDAGGAGGRAANEALDPAEIERDNQRRYLFREAVSPAHQTRYDAFSKVKLRTQEVRRLVNATLSQSVPQNVVTVVGAYTKMFAGMIVEGARDVQSEWMAVDALRADGEANPAFKRLKLMQPSMWDEESEEEEDDDDGDDDGDEDEDEGSGKGELDRGEEAGVEEKQHQDTQDERKTTAPTSPDVKMEETQPDPIVKREDDDDSKADTLPHQPSSATPSSTKTTASAAAVTPTKLTSGSPPQPSSTDQLPLPTNNKNDTAKPSATSSPSSTPPLLSQHTQPGAWNLATHISDCDRGPLLPDHLRESLRRYRKARAGGSVGFTGLSLEGNSNAAPRMGGRRLFD